VRYHALVARTVLFAISLFAATASLVSFERTLDPQRLSDAIDLGQSRIDDLRSRFHASYHVEVSRVPVDYVEIVTPFRRVALEAEARTRAGERLFGQREALAALGTDPSRVDIVVEMTFHPLNNFIGVPDYAVTLRAMVDAPPILPRQIGRIPRYGPRLSATRPYPYSAGTPVSKGSQPLLGGTIVATFDGLALDAQGAYWAVVSDSDKELARARVDFAKLR
jgi:hypothetical protein